MTEQVREEVMKRYNELANGTTAKVLELLNCHLDYKYDSKMSTFTTFIYINTNDNIPLYFKHFINVDSIEEFSDPLHTVRVNCDIMCYFQDIDNVITALSMYDWSKKE